MTCNEDCACCIYGAPKETYYICKSKNTTCNGTCSECIYGKSVVVGYVCGKNIGVFNNAKSTF